MPLKFTLDKNAGKIHRVFGVGDDKVVPFQNLIQSAIFDPSFGSWSEAVVGLVKQLNDNEIGFVIAIGLQSLRRELANDIIKNK